MLGQFGANMANVVVVYILHVPTSRSQVLRATASRNELRTLCHTKYMRDIRILHKDTTRATSASTAWLRYQVLWLTKEKT